MTDEEAFLRAIAFHPQDDLPRLVYADWLDERGDQRADYLRFVVESRTWMTKLRQLNDARDALDREWVEAVGHPSRVMDFTHSMVTVLRFRRGNARCSHCKVAPQYAGMRVEIRVAEQAETTTICWNCLGLMFYAFHRMEQ